jgi:hypothetical protein
MYACAELHSTDIHLCTLSLNASDDFDSEAISAARARARDSLIEQADRFRRA